MAAAPFVIERKVQYHGIWNTGLQVTDQFLKNIAQQFDTKPPCPTFLTLGVNAITLVVLTRTGEKELHRDHIAFDALREIAVNAYNPKCLMILYINKQNRFSIIVCSCLDNNEAVNISLAYKQLKNYRLVNANKNNNHIKQNNWTLKKSSRDLYAAKASPNGSGPRDDSISTRSRTESGVMNETFAFLNNEDVSVNGDGDHDDDVFGGLEPVERVPVSGDDSTADAFHAGLQVNLEDQLHKAGSISSRSSFVSLQSVSDEVKVIENGGYDPESPGIDQSEFFRREPMNELTGSQREAVEDDKETGENNNNSDTKPLMRIVKTDDNDKADFRSVSTQTITGGIKRHYKKRVGSTHTSNVYREMAAQRKNGQFNGSTYVNSISNTNIPTNGSSRGINDSSRGLNGSSNGFKTPMNVPTATAEFAGFTSMANGNFLRARSSSFNSGIRYKSLYMPRQVQTSSSSVSRPIEDVYRTWSRGKRTEAPSRSRRVIVYTQQRK